jgi:PAS domain S-box-containing protein
MIKASVMNLTPSQTSKPRLFILDVHNHLNDTSFNSIGFSQRLLEQGFEVYRFHQLDALIDAVKLQTDDPSAVALNTLLVVWLDSGGELDFNPELKIRLSQLNVGRDQAIPWVVIVNEIDMAKQIAAYQLGVSHYWVKPQDGADLLQKLMQLTQPPQSPYRVLMVDDSAMVLRAQTEILRHAGMMVHSLTNPMDLAGLLKTDKPDVLVLDLHMPEACGAQVAWAVRQAQSEAELPIVFVSGESNIEDQMLALKQGGDDFLVKPVNPNHFVETIKMRAERARQHNRVQKLLKHKLYEQSLEHQALNHHAIVSIADRAGNIVEVNDLFCQISGFQREELLGQNHRVVKSDYHSADFYQQLWQTIASGRVWQGEVCNLSKQGHRYWVQSTITPFFNEKGEVYQYVSIRTDITKIKQLEIEQQKRLFEQGERVKEWRCLNRIMSLLSNDEVDDHTLLHQVVNAIPPGWRNPEDTCALLELNGVCYATADFVETQWCQYSEIKLDGFKGRLVVCRIQPDPLEQEDGYGILLHEEQGLLENIGLQIGQALQRREAKRASQAAKNEAEKANRAKSEFLSSMSHELRTPLNSIIGFAQLLGLSELNEKQKQQLSTLAMSGKHLLALINDVLEFSKLESGKLKLDIQSVEVRPIIEEAVALSGSQAYAQNIKIYTPNWGAPIWIHADPLRFKQVLLNIMSNGIKYNRPNGKLKLNWQTFEQANRRYWQLRIEDSGVGIAQQDLAHLFEPFNRLGHEGSTIEGTGIGLSITKDLIEQMGGRIEVESQLGVGTRFMLTFPLIEPNTAHNEIGAIESAFVFDSQTEREGAKVIKVLYVEDNLASMKLMADLLESMEGVELKLAPNAENGLQQAQAWLPDLILLDIQLPGLSGDQALRHFQALPGYPSRRPKIVALTANGLKEQVRYYRSIGFDQVMVKPFDLEQITKLLGNLSD